MKKYERGNISRGARGGAEGGRDSSSSLFTIPIDGVHFAALSASPRTPREMMHDRNRVVAAGSRHKHTCV
jgi:hypothetical protein